MALNARIELIRRAQRSLDLQYYELHDDESGRLVLRELRDAARRGVRIRFLLDDMYTQGLDELLTGLAAFPNVEVRLFNPFPTRGSTASRFFWSLADFSRVNRRMHNKMFVADNAIAVVGGRNLGNEYFTSGKSINYFDFDVVTVGAILPQLSSLFEQYWNSPYVWPVQAVAQSNQPQDALRSRFDALVAVETTPEPATPPSSDRLGYPPLSVDLDRGFIALSFGTAQAFADSPRKAEGQVDTLRLPSGATLGNIRGVLVAEMERATEEIFSTTPYFVPGERGLERMRKNIGRGVKISMLTNSLASTDEPVVHTGYRRYRDNMLKIGVTLYELSPSHSENLLFAGMPKLPFRLHTKSSVMDRKVAFIGSLNIDPRSEEHNTELGLLVRDPVLAGDMHKIIALYREDAAYQVVLAKNKRSLEWHHADPINGDEVLTSEPDVGLWTRFKLEALSAVIPEGWL